MIANFFSPEEIRFLESLPQDKREAVIREQMRIREQPPSPAAGSSDYDAHKERARLRQAAQTAKGQDIGSIPWDGVDWKRRLRAREDFAFFCKTYQPKTFSLPWAAYHHDIIEGIQYTAWNNDSQAIGVPRAGGKSKLVCAGGIWAALNTWKTFLFFVGATEPKGQALLRNIVTQLRINPRLRQDYPEVCYPISMLGRSARKCEGQKCLGEATAMFWSVSKFIFPTIRVEPGEIPDEVWSIIVNAEGFTRTSGSMAQCAGITGDLRGPSETTESLDEYRPDWVVADDFQTRDSSKSREQCRTRLKTITADLGYLGGPDSPCSVIVPCTVMHVGDAADQLLDPDKHPEFHGIRRKMLSSMPKNMKAVRAYIEHVKDVARTVPRNQQADARNKYYIENQSELEEGAVATWPERMDTKKKKELSAIQHAIHLMATSLDAFYCEGQNDPQGVESRESVRIQPIDIQRKQHPESKGIVPSWATQLAVTIDLQKEGLYYEVGACSQDFRGAIIEYGTFPDQQRPYYRRDQLVNRLSDIYPKITKLETRLRLALVSFLQFLDSNRWNVEGGGTMKASMIVPDARYWGGVVDQAIKESEVTNAMPFLGYGLGVKKKPMDAWKQDDGETKGFHWHIGTIPSLGSTKVFKVDKYFWQTELHKCIAIPLGEDGSWSLYNADIEQHELFADHLNSEADKVLRDVYDGREVREWIQPPDAQNEFFDTSAVMLACMSRLGCSLPDVHIFAEEEDDEEEVVIEFEEWEE